MNRSLRTTFTSFSALFLALSAQAEQRGQEAAQPEPIQMASLDISTSATISYGQIDALETPEQKRLARLGDEARKTFLGQAVMANMQPDIRLRFNAALNNKNACGNRLNGIFHGEEGLMDFNPKRDDTRLALTMFHEPAHGILFDAGHSGYQFGNFRPEDRDKISWVNEALVRALTNTKAYFHLLEGDDSYFEEQLSRSGYKHMLYAFMREIDPDSPYDVTAAIEASIVAFRDREMSMASSRRQVLDWIVDNDQVLDSTAAVEELVTREKLQDMGDLRRFGLEGNFMSERLIGLIQNQPLPYFQQSLNRRIETGKSICTTQITADLNLDQVSLLSEKISASPN